MRELEVNQEPIAGKPQPKIIYYGETNNPFLGLRSFLFKIDSFAWFRVTGAMVLQYRLG